MRDGGRPGLFCRGVTKNLAIVITAALASAAAACQPGTPTCYVAVDAVTVDAVDPSVVTLVANGGVARAATGQRIWAFLTDDATPGLLSTADGGVVALNVGAAARRFDAAGNVLWSVGYGASVGDVGALMGDNLLLADAEAVRLIDPTGAVIWSRELGAAAVTAATGDRAGGAWIVGKFAGTFPPWVTAGTPAEMGPAGPFLVAADTPLQTLGNGNANPFVVHLDATGAVVGGGAWLTPVAFSQAVVAVDGAGQPILVARGATSDGWPLIAAFDATGALLWARKTDTAAPLAVDATGTLFAVSAVVGITDPSTVQIQQWDPSGVVVANVAAPVTLPPHDSFQVVTATTPDGFVAVGAVVAEANNGGYQFCTPQHTMFRFQTQTMTATSEPLEGL
jgi:hypothetical protein